MDLKRIKSLVKLVEDSGISQLSVEHDGMKIDVKKELNTVAPVVTHAVAPVQSVAAAPVPEVATAVPDAEASLTPIKAQMVGTFYKSASPDTAPFVSVGSTVKQGDVLCVIEAMKLFNEFVSEWNGTIKKICIENGDAIEFGQILFLIDES